MEILPAIIQAELHDLGPYPAITEGLDRVGGEVWRFEHTDIRRTLAVLDEIEGYQQDGNDLYLRRTMECTTLDERTLIAYTYFYADRTELTDNTRIPPSRCGLSIWPDR